MAISLDDNVLRIVTAPWVVTMNGPVIRDGAVAIDAGRIAEVDTLETLTARYGAVEVESFPGVFIPALVNAHAHLELSHLPGTAFLGEDETFTNWVEALVKKRVENHFSLEELSRLAPTPLEYQFNSGVVFVGDIGNDPCPNFLNTKNKKSPEVYHMLELLGSTRDAQEHSLEILSRLHKTTHAVAHAPYSTRPALLKEIKKRCDDLGHVFSIHTAENEAEKDFIITESGEFFEFLKKRGSWTGDFFREAPKSKSTVDYFSQLGLLNEKTLLVHCVHLSACDLEVIKDSGAHVCVCPGSNAFLHSGQAPIEQMLAHDILPAIGTDSIASNLSLDMWLEMQRISHEQPNIDALDILRMATLGGASAFGRTEDYGTLSQGRKASFLHVFSSKINNCTTEDDLLKMLVTYGRPEKIEWVQQFSMSSRSNQG